MADKTFTNVRLGLKIDSLENWGNSSLVLKRGEVAFATTTVSTGEATSESVIMMKVGDGEKTFSQLPNSFYAKALDVLSACKSEDALKAFINSVIAEAGIATDEALSNLAKRVGEAETAVQANTDAIAVLNGEDEGSVAKAIADAIEALDLSNTYDAIGAADDVKEEIEGLIGEVADGKTVVEMIKDAQAAATYDDAQVKSDIQANAEAIDAIEADYLKVADKTELQGNIDAKANQTALEEEIARAKVAEQSNADAIALLTNGVDTETIDGVNDLINYVNTHGTEVTGMKADIKANSDAIGVLNGDATVVGSVDKKIADAIAAENLDQYATDAELGGLAERVTTAEGDIDALEAKVGEQTVAAQIEAAIEALKMGDYAKAADLTDALGRIEQNETDIAALEDAVEDKANDADLADVAKSGLIDDLSVGEGTVLVIDCGTSAEVATA